MDLATAPSLTPLDTEARSNVPMSDAEFDSLLGSAEFQDFLGPPGAGGGAAAGADDLAEPLASDFGWAGDKSLDAFLRDGNGGSQSPSAGLDPSSGNDLASGLRVPSPSADPMQLDTTLPMPDVAEAAGRPSTDTAPNPSYASGTALSGGPPSGCATPTAVSEAGARFADAALSPPNDAGLRAEANNGATSSQSESVEMSMRASPGIASGAVSGWPASSAPTLPQMGMQAGPGPPLAPHMQHQPPHLMPAGAAPGAAFGYGGLQYGAMQYGGSMAGSMGPMAAAMHPAMKGSGNASAGSMGVMGPMEWRGTSAPMQAQQQVWPVAADQSGMWGTQPGGGYGMQPGGSMFGGKVFGQPFGVQKSALRSGSEVWSSSGSGQSTQSGFQHPLLGSAMTPGSMQQQQQLQHGSPHQQQLTIQSGSQAQVQLPSASQPAGSQPQQQQQQRAQSTMRAQRPRSTRRAAHRSSHDTSPQLKASSDPEVQAVPAASPRVQLQQEQAAAQQQAAMGLAGGFYPAPHNAYCMPAQMPGPGPAAFSGPPGAPASMTGLPAGGMVAAGAAGFLPMAPPGFGCGPQRPMQPGGPGPHAMGRHPGSRSQPASPAFQQQHSAPGGMMATTPRAAGKRSSASFGELGGLSPRGGSSKSRGAYSQPGTPRSEALVLEELKALIGQLDPTTKATMKNSLYRISRNAAGSGSSSDAGVAAEAAAQAAKKPNSPDEVGPVDRLVADLLYKEPLQQAPNLPQQLAETARAQTAAAEERWGSAALDVA